VSFPDSEHKLFNSCKEIKIVASCNIATFPSHEREKNATKFWLEKGPVGRVISRLEESRIDCKDIGWEGVDRIRLAQDKAQWQIIMNTVVDLRFSKKAGNFLTI
jgi:hypothetical protein